MKNMIYYGELGYYGAWYKYRFMRFEDILLLFFIIVNVPNQIAQWHLYNGGC
jgi:hypothetical protein